MVRAHVVGMQAETTSSAESNIKPGEDNYSTGVLFGRVATIRYDSVLSGSLACHPSHAIERASSSITHVPSTAACPTLVSSSLATLEAGMVSNRKTEFNWYMNELLRRRHVPVSIGAQMVRHDPQRSSLETATLSRHGGLVAFHCRPAKDFASDGCLGPRLQAYVCLLSGAAGLSPKCVVAFGSGLGEGRILGISLC